MGLEQGILFRIGYLFEYKNEQAYKDCQEIWQEIESNMKAEQAVKVFEIEALFLWMMLHQEHNFFSACSLSPKLERHKKHSYITIF